MELCGIHPAWLRVGGGRTEPPRNSSILLVPCVASPKDIHESLVSVSMETSGPIPTKLLGHFTRCKSVSVLFLNSPFYIDFSRLLSASTTLCNTPFLFFNGKISYGGTSLGT